MTALVTMNCFILTNVLKCYAQRSDTYVYQYLIFKILHIEIHIFYQRGKFRIVGVLVESKAASIACGCFCSPLQEGPIVAHIIQTYN